MNIHIHIQYRLPLVVSPSPCPSLSLLSLPLVSHSFSIHSSACAGPAAQNRRTAASPQANVQKPGQYLAIGSRWTVRPRPKTRGYKAPCSAERMALFFLSGADEGHCKKAQCQNLLPDIFHIHFAPQKNVRNRKERNSFSAPIRTTRFETRCFSLCLGRGADWQTINLVRHIAALRRVGSHAEGKPWL